MSSTGLDFLTAFRLSRFEIRVLGYEVTVSPTLLAELDVHLCSYFEMYHADLRRVPDGFHFLDSCEVSEYVLF